jgi:hypothetical protein
LNLMLLIDGVTLSSLMFLRLISSKSRSSFDV